MAKQNCIFLLLLLLFFTTQQQYVVEGFSTVGSSASLLLTKLCHKEVGRKPKESCAHSSLLFQPKKSTAEAAKLSSSGTKLKSVAASLEGGAQTASKAESGGTSTIPDSIFNLVKGIVGAGVLSLPAGIAAYGNAPSAIVPALGLIAAIGALSAYGFSLIGRVCSYTGATSYGDAWTKSVDESTAWIPAVSCTLKTFSAVLAYSMILADTGRALLETAGFGGVSRTRSLLGITLVPLLPLCWLKNLSSLAPFSLLGVLGMFYTTGAMAFRYLGKAYAGATPKFTVAPNLTPSFGAKGAGAVWSPSSFILICMLSTAYMAHFNAPKFFTELKNNTVERYNTVVSSSFGIAILLLAAVSTLGFLTFGGNTSGLILNNYSTSDAIMSFSRIAVGLSLVFSFPLAFVGVREGTMDLLRIKDRSDATQNKLTVALLSVVTFLAMKLTDVSFVLAFAGATLGNALIYVYPAIMFRGAVQKMPEEKKSSFAKEVKLALGMATMGIVFGVIGSVMAVQSIM